MSFVHLNAEDYMRLFFLTVGSAAVLVANMGLAQADAIADRQAIMKDLGRSVGAIAPVVKGEKPFDAAAVLTALKHVEKFRTDAAAAVAAEPQDVDALKTAFQQVAANCGSCHQAFRVKKN
jgi:cytochrome c556